MPESSSSSSSSGPITPTAAQAAQLKLAVTFKAARFLKLVQAPMGVVGEVTEFGVAYVRTDRQIGELLYGLKYKNLDVASAKPTAEELVESVYGPGSQVPETVEAQAEAAIEAAVGWVTEYLAGFGAA